MRKIAARVVTIWIVLFIVYFVLTRPTDAAHYMRDWYDGVHSAASSVSKLLSSF
jgi:hypothetical protein